MPAARMLDARQFIGCVGPGLVVGICLSLLLACRPSEPEQAIREAITRIETGLEERDAGDVMAELAEFFDGNGYLDRKGVHRLLVAQFLRYQKIHIVLTNVEILLSEPDHGRASMSATAVVTGASGLIPDDGRLWRLHAEWELIDGDWLLTRLRWK